MTEAVQTVQRPSPAIQALNPEQVLQDLQVRGLLAEGKAHLISVAAVQLAFGARWRERKALVWEMTDGQIRRRIGVQDFTARLNETDFLIITPGLEAAGAQVLAVRVLQDVLNHFLGESRPTDITINIVTGISAGAIACRQLTEEEVSAILTRGAGRAAGAGSILAPIAAPDADSFAILDGRRLRFSSSVDPIIDLRKWAVAGQRIEPKIEFDDSRAPLTSAERRQMLPKDVQAIDMATLKRGLTRLTSGQSAASKPSLIMTVSFLTLSNTKARTALLAEANRARPLMTQAVIFEITDFEEGLPLSRMEESVGLLKPFCRSVFARRDISVGSAKVTRSFGVSGLVAQAPQSMTLEGDLVNWLIATGRAMEAQASTLIAANLPSRSLLPSAFAAGFTHATIRA